MTASTERRAQPASSSVTTKGQARETGGEPIVGGPCEGGPSAWIATRDIVLGEKVPGYPPLEPTGTP